jgi:hypothetical protein
VAAQHVLYARASDCEPDAHGHQLVRYETDALEQVRAAFLEPPGGTEGLGAREQQLDPLPGWRAVGHQAQGGPEPTGGARGRTKCGRLSGLSEDRQRPDIALAGGVLHVVCSGQR